MHSFHAYELPELLHKQENDNLLPSDCCQDFILWQCIVDKVVEKELAVPETGTNNSERVPRKLSHVEQNAIAYCAGSVIRKMLNKWKDDAVKTECLKQLVKDRDLIDDLDSSQLWLNASDRGGFFHISDVGLDLFMEIEVFVYDHLMEKDVRDMDTLKFMACQDPDILSIWSHLEEIDDISTDIATMMQS